MARIVLALGGNALASSDDPSGYTAVHQIGQIARTSEILADLIAAGNGLVVAHGNGPQVGNLLAKNDIARDVVPAVPLYWCVAQTQATTGMELASALKRNLARRGISGLVVPVLTRVLVDPTDPAFSAPTKPIGIVFSGEAPPDTPLPADHAWKAVAPGRWHRVVPSPRPLEILDADVIALVTGAGGTVVACGGGGVPFARSGEDLVGIDAVVDKDLTAVLLAELVCAGRIVILTDVDGVALDFGKPTERYVDRIGADDLERYLVNGEFGAGSMDAKVEAAIRFVRRTGRSAAIGRLENARAVIDGLAGTHVMAVAV